MKKYTLNDLEALRNPLLNNDVIISTRWEYELEQIEKINNTEFKK